jgi:hypothetical protein
MATTLKIVAGNTAPNWLITCERAGTPINLAGCVVTLDISDGSIVTRTAGVCTITDSANGVVSYQPTASDCPDTTTYKVDVKITYGDSSHEILFEQLKVKTRASLI